MVISQHPLDVPLYLWSFTGTSTTTCAYPIPITSLLNMQRPVTQKCLHRTPITWTFPYLQSPFTKPKTPYFSYKWPNPLTLREDALRLVLQSPWWAALWINLGISASQCLFCSLSGKWTWFSNRGTTYSYNNCPPLPRFWPCILRTFFFWPHPQHMEVPARDWIWATGMVMPDP